MSEVVPKSLNSDITDTVEVKVDENKEKHTWFEEHFDEATIEQIRLVVAVITVSAIPSLIVKSIYIILESGFDPVYIVSKVYPFIIGSIPAIIRIFKLIANLVNILELPVYIWKFMKFIKNKVFNKHKSYSQ